METMEPTLQWKKDAHLDFMEHRLSQDLSDQSRAYAANNGA